MSDPRIIIPIKFNTRTGCIAYPLAQLKNQYLHNPLENLMNMKKDQAIAALDAIELCLNPAMTLFCRDVKRYIQSVLTTEDIDKSNAAAVMGFANAIAAAYEAGFVSDVVNDLMLEQRQHHTVTLWRGIKTPKRHEDFISFNADEIIEKMSESAFEECGELADDYLPPLAPGQAESLENHMNKAAASWFNAHIPQPTFWLADKLEEMELTL